ncbi:MAG: tRNA lysidine(34) synthetase TilS [Cyclobacteriaceae bacterium]|nr:tRNA lysidine(34) synthetase TilS [Cyclobacteriaceae bacterium]
MLEQFTAHIRQHNLCSPTDRLLLAISGGMDSMTMLHLFVSAGYNNLAVAHANFRLRGKESDEDEQFVQQYSAARGIAFFKRHFDTENYARQNGISVQMAARELRYSWFDELIEQENFSAVATAHTLTDAIETSLMNFLHGAPTEGLAGIPVKNNRVIRPLLFASRKEVEHYARENRITWREDSSNASDKYLRNYLRHHVLPHFSQVNPSWEDNAGRTLEKLHGSLILQQLGLKLITEKFIRTEPTCVTLSKEFFRTNAHPLILHKLIEDYGFNYPTCVNIMKAVHEQPGKKFLSATHQLTIDRDALIITPHPSTNEDVLIGQEQPKAVMGSRQLVFHPARISERPAAPASAVLDADKLVFPLRWRAWKPGDYFYPLGLGHRKKISDFLIDNKIPLPEKNRVTVLESGGKVAWVVGYRIDDRFKITSETKRAICITLSTDFT